MENCGTICEIPAGVDKTAAFANKVRISVDDMSVFSWSSSSQTKNVSGVGKITAQSDTILLTSSIHRVTKNIGGCPPIRDGPA